MDNDYKTKKNYSISVLEHFTFLQHEIESLSLNMEYFLLCFLENYLIHMMLYTCQ